MENFFITPTSLKIYSITFNSVKIPCSHVEPDEVNSPAGRMPAVPAQSLTASPQASSGHAEAQSRRGGTKTVQAQRLLCGLISIMLYL